MPEISSLYSQKTCSITHFKSPIQSDQKKCFVLFSSWGARDLDGKIGGVNPLLRAGFDVLTVQTNADDWHQNIYPNGIEILRDFVAKNYDFALGYGSSMGAYGALLYADTLGLDAVLALSPQYAINQDFDTRWKQFSDKISWKLHMDQAAGYRGRIHIFYDPKNPDAEHFRLFQENFSKADLKGHPIKFSSHPTTHYLNDGGALKSVLLSFASGDLSIPTVNNRTNKTYLSELSGFLSEKGKDKSSFVAGVHAIEQGERRNAFLRRIALLSMKLGDNMRAEKYARLAIDSADNTEMTTLVNQEALARILIKSGNIEAANDIIEAVLKAAPDRGVAQKLKEKILALSGSAARGASASVFPGKRDQKPQSVLTDGEQRDAENTRFSPRHKISFLLKSLIGKIRTPR